MAARSTRSAAGTPDRTRAEAKLRTVELDSLEGRIDTATLQDQAAAYELQSGLPGRLDDEALRLAASGYKCGNC